MLAVSMLIYNGAGSFAQCRLEYPGFEFPMACFRISHISIWVRAQKCNSFCKRMHARSNARLLPVSVLRNSNAHHTRGSLQQCAGAGDTRREPHPIMRVSAGAEAAPRRGAARAARCPPNRHMIGAGYSACVHHRRFVFIFLTCVGWITPRYRNDASSVEHLPVRHIFQKSKINLHNASLEKNRLWESHFVTVCVSKMYCCALERGRRCE